MKALLKTYRIELCVGTLCGLLAGVGTGDWSTGLLVGAGSLAMAWVYYLIFDGDK